MMPTDLFVLGQTAVSVSQMGQPADVVFQFLAKPVGKGYMVHLVIAGLAIVSFFIGFVIECRRKIDNGVRSVTVGTFQGGGSAGRVSGTINEFRQVYAPFRRTLLQRTWRGLVQGMVWGFIGPILTMLFGMIALFVITFVVSLIY